MQFSHLCNHFSRNLINKKSTKRIKYSITTITTILIQLFTFDYFSFASKWEVMKFVSSISGTNNFNKINQRVITFQLVTTNSQSISYLGHNNIYVHRLDVHALIQSFDDPIQ